MSSSRNVLLMVLQAHIFVEAATGTPTTEGSIMGGIDDLHFPPFEEAMGNRSISWGWWHRDDREWIPVFHSLYDTNLRSQAINSSRTNPDGENLSQAQPRIPRIIHQVWLGGKPIPDQFQVWRASCISKHPEWKHILWTEEELKDFPFLRREAYDSAPNLGAKSDAVRLELVWRFGGLYMDTDFECLRPFDQLHARLDFFAALSNVGSLEISNGIFAARKRHLLVEQAILAGDAALPPPGAAAQLDWIGMPTIASSGPGRFTRVVMQALSALADSATDAHASAGDVANKAEAAGFGRVVILPINFVFPLPNSLVSADYSTRLRVREEMAVPEALAVHHWAGSWLKEHLGLPLVWKTTAPAKSSPASLEESDFEL